MALFWALAGSKWVRRLTACFVVVGAYAIWESRVENRGAERVIVKVNQSAEKISADAKKARTRADHAADPAAELRKRTCPGC